MKYSTDMCVVFIGHVDPKMKTDVFIKKKGRLSYGNS